MERRPRNGGPRARRAVHKDEGSRPAAPALAAAGCRSGHTRRAGGGVAGQRGGSDAWRPGGGRGGGARARMLQS